MYYEDVAKQKKSHYFQHLRKQILLHIGAAIAVVFLGGVAVAVVWLAGSGGSDANKAKETLYDDPKGTTEISPVETTPPTGVCCLPDTHGKCQDGTDSTPCCGTQSCNFWCCSCISCWKKRSRRDTSHFQSGGGGDPLERFDKDEDGFLNRNEAMALHGACGNVTVAEFNEKFIEFDRNHDGLLSLEEINS